MMYSKTAFVHKDCAFVGFPWQPRETKQKTNYMISYVSYMLQYYDNTGYSIYYLDLNCI